MAKTGLRYIVVAKIKSETDGQPPVYEQGMVLGAGIAADISFTINESQMYANNALKESSKSITGGEISMELDDLLAEARAYAMGVSVVEEDDVKTYRTTGKTAPNVGVGFIEERVYNGKTTHLPTWLYKVQFAPGAKNIKTRGENVEFQSTKVTGDMMGVYPDDSGDVAFMDDREYEDGALATAWINEMAGITAE